MSRFLETTPFFVGAGLAPARLPVGREGAKPVPSLLSTGLMILILAGATCLPAEEDDQTAMVPAAMGDPTAWNIEGAPEQPAAVLVRGATIWTSGDEGTIENADLLIENGTIKRVGTGLSAPGGATIIDGTGKHVTAGLIDAHNHSAIVGSVNEGSNITTAEVRIENLVNAESINVYWQLAGGLTTANLLHGSANAIDGQNTVMKMRWGAAPRDMIMTEAPAGIKFALGENPKQSNWGDNVELRYPQTRQGVEQAIRERFMAAEDYRNRPRLLRTDAVPLRRDLQLDAIVEIIEGKRLIHSHSYRADEIIMLMRLMEQFGVTVATFQHVLEGYKVADELAAHGAGASTFSDWWAYKYEVVDAIPYNGAIMHDRDVVVSFNSDDEELARRLNLEAAKAVRYGGVSEAEALEFVTLNPAKQLGIDRWVGSLEAGKHADFVIWSEHPLSTYARVDQTWVDGRKYFDREADVAGRATRAAERQALLERIRAQSAADEESADEAGETSEGEAEVAETPDPPLSYRLWEHNYDAYCLTHDHKHGLAGHAAEESHR